MLMVMIARGPGRFSLDSLLEFVWRRLRRIGTLRTVTSYTAWPFSIVRHECRRRMRGQMPLPDNDNRIFAYYTRPDLRIDLATAIQSLPEKYREAIVLRDFEEYSISEIAQALRLTHEAAKSRIHRRRHMIREYLQD